MRKDQVIYTGNMSIGKAMVRAFLVNFAAAAGTFTALGLVGNAVMKAQQSKDE